ncbi:Golgi-associated kinase 1A [Antechinus flavipes]|uniref:Golgi-associated kinase 1A n=1 Tax=Antechinus flavipes TaxID=38775 RepID=UPI00223696C0|nr:Golgi-associated kinase 1A [Antechinus flavipes]
MASWLWRRLRGKRRPLTGFCFFLAMSVVVLTGFSPGFPGAPTEPPGWARRPPRAMDVIAPAGPKAPSSRHPGRMVPQGPRVSPESPSLVCKDDGGSRGRGRSRAHLGKPSGRRGRAKRDVAARTVAARGESSATSHPGGARKVLRGRRDARGQRAKGPEALRRGRRDARLPELPIKEVPPGREGRLGQKPSAAGPPALASLHEAFGAGGGAPGDAAVQAAGAGEDPGPGPEDRAGSHAQGRTASLWPASAGELRASAWCGPGEGGPPGAGETPPWFSADDVWKMRLLARGEVTGRARVPGHGQVLRVGLSVGGGPGGAPPDLGRLCSEGRCGLIKRAQDLPEVLAFHLDRVLGLSRSLPVVARRFHSPLLPYRFTRGEPRPVVWWAPDVRHLNDSDNDQNSFALGWQRYQALLRLRCGSGAPLAQPPCLGIRHTEWARLALFDFLLQVHDRLDRHCCGFEPEPSDPCLEERLREKCRNPGELLLVHILVRESDPSRLVYIDNAGKLLHPQTKLNFRLLEGIDGFPESAVKVIASGCLENLLLRSLQTDPEFWDSQGGPRGLKPLLLPIAERAQVLLEYIRERNLTLFGEEAGGGHGLPLT